MSAGTNTLEQWKQYLVLTPSDVIKKTFEVTTQLYTNIESENKVIGRRHFKSKFPALKEQQINDIYSSLTHFFL